MSIEKTDISGEPKRATRRPRGMGAAYVYDCLKTDILDLVLKPGTLLDETVLGRQFGVSRSPVREALIRLSAEGLVQNLRNRTSIVAQFDVAALPAYFDALQLLYRLSARLAAFYPNPAKIGDLRQNVRLHEQALIGEQFRSAIRINREFHMSVAEMGRNPFIAKWLSEILDQGQRILRLYALKHDERDPGTALQHHREMVVAIEAGDTDRAEEAARLDAQNLIDNLTLDLLDRPTAALDLRPLKKAGQFGH